MIPWAHPSPQPKPHLDQFPVFAQLTAECPYTSQWDAPFPLKIAASHGDLDPHLTHDSLGPPEATTQMASQSVQPFLQGSLLRQTDQQTDRPTDHAIRSVTRGRIYERSTAMQPKNYTTGCFVMCSLGTS